MPSVVATDTRAARNRMLSMIRSLTWREARCDSRLADMGWAMESQSL